MKQHWARTLTLLVVVFVVLVGRGDLQGVCGSCIPDQAGSRSGLITYRFDSSLIGGQQSAYNDAAAQWTSTLSGSGIALGWSATGTVLVSLDYGVCPDWGEARFGQQNYIKICPDTYDEDVNHPGFLERTIAHEFGHIAGISHGTCSKADSVMTVVQPNQMTGAITTPGCADRDAVEQYFIPRRDVDNDGYSPDEFYQANQDCDDEINPVHPGANINCDYAAEYPDKDCDGLPDTYECGSPVILDVDGDGIQLTSRTGGVLFDLDSDGVREQLPWTAAHVDDAWLVFDRDGNGTIDDGTELFGSFSPQPASSEPNGFLALAMFDEQAAGGNGDGSITALDAVFSQLRLWQDRDHNGYSSAGELLALNESGVKSIDYDYQDIWRTDKYGNVFRYKARVARVRRSDVARWAYDVFLWASDNPIRQRNSSGDLPVGRPR